MERLTLNLFNYKRQHVSVLNAKGEKKVWINLFCNDSLGKWKTDIVDVSDGGNCYFNLKLNFCSNKYYDLMFNGEA